MSVNIIAARRRSPCAKVLLRRATEDKTVWETKKRLAMRSHRTPREDCGLSRDTWRLHWRTSEYGHTKSRRINLQTGVTFAPSPDGKPTLIHNRGFSTKGAVVEMHGNVLTISKERPTYMGEAIAQGRIHDVNKFEVKTKRVSPYDFKRM